jgi:AraC-like DNA-binding protein
MDFTQLNYKGHIFAREFSLADEMRFSFEMADAACLTYIDNGSQEMISPSKSTTINSSHTVLAKCGKYVTQVKGGGENNKLSGIVFHLNPEIIKEAFKGINTDFLHASLSSGPSKFIVDLGSSRLIDSFVDSMRPYFCSDSKVNDRLLGLKLQELVNILIAEGNEEVLYILGTIRHKEIFDFEEVIESNLYNNLSLEELAHLTSKSISTFKRLFKKHFDTTPAAYFRNKKIARAAELLASSNLTIGEICWDCGFDSLSHFSSSFKKELSFSPSEFRSKQSRLP